MERDCTFTGCHRHHVEAFFRTRTDSPPRPTVFTEEELTTYLEARFVQRAAFERLDTPLESPDLEAILHAMLD